MSKEFKEFNQNWGACIKYWNELRTDLEKNHNALLKIFKAQAPSESFDDFFSKPHWSGLDKTTLFKFRAYILYDAIFMQVQMRTARRLTDKFDGILTFDRASGKIIPSGNTMPSSIQKLTPLDVKGMIDNLFYISDSFDEIRKNRTGAEIMLNFLKSCVNLLVSLLTFGYQPNFFKSNTFYLEKLQQIQEKCYQIYQKLPKAEKNAELTI